MRHTLISLALAVWVLVTLTCFATYYFTDRVNTELRAQITLLQEIRIIQEQECQGIRRVNILCEQVVNDFAVQLGITVSPAPILTTAIQRRHELAIGGLGGAE